ERVLERFERRVRAKVVRDAGQMIVGVVAVVADHSVGEDALCEPRSEVVVVRGHAAGGIGHGLHAIDRVVRGAGDAAGRGDGGDVVRQVVAVADHDAGRLGDAGQAVENVVAVLRGSGRGRCGQPFAGRRVRERGGRPVEVVDALDVIATVPGETV